MNLQRNDAGQLSQPDQTTCGSLAKRDVELLDLLKKEGIESDLLWIPAPRAATDRKGTLWLTIYGAREIAKDLGNTLQEAQVYLQDPIHAQRNTLYWNPQRFQNAEDLYTTSFRYKENVSCPEVGPFKAVDVLKDFVSEDNLPETKGCASLRTCLKGYCFLSILLFIKTDIFPRIAIK